jgi:hypothetical protein
MITEEALPTYMTMLNTLDGVRDETGASQTPWGIWTRAWTAEENRCAAAAAGRLLPGPMLVGAALPPPLCADAPPARPPADPPADPPPLASCPNRHGDLMNKYMYLTGRVNMKSIEVRGAGPASRLDQQTCQPARPPASWSQPAS